MEEATDNWRNSGFHFSFDPELLDRIAQEGTRYQGEYGSYQYLNFYEGAAEATYRTKSLLAPICLISDALVPVGIAYSLHVDNHYTIPYYKFRLDLPWKKKGDTLTFHLFGSESMQYVQLGLYQTNSVSEVKGLIQKAIQAAIELTEQELSTLGGQA